MMCIIIMRDDDGDYLLQGLIPNIGGGRCVVGPFTNYYIIYIQLLFY